MSPLLSIIVPVYNVEPYLEECLASVLGQNLDAETYEIILVDDKSTDGSLALCERFAAKHAHIRVFPLPENSPGGAGFPSNFGLKHARGKYVGFTDSDDYASPDMFAGLLAEAERTGADLTLCSFHRHSLRDAAILPPEDEAAWQRLFEPDFEALPLLEKKKCCLKLSPVPWRKLYRREFLAKNRILYPVGDFFYEDLSLHWFTTVLATSIARIDRRLITHRIEREGQTVGREMGRMFLQVAENLRIIRKFLLDKGVYADYRRPFWDLAIAIVAFTPPGNPLRGQVESVVADICAAPPEEGIPDIFGTRP
jgi:glycosyltransferase involved in cell wall biosynthesis